MIDVRHDISVRKSQYPIAFTTKPDVALSIGGLAQHVLSAVRFNDELAFQACKVGHISAYWLLAPELPPAQLAIPQVAPKNLLHEAWVFPKGTRALYARRAAGRGPPHPLPPLPRWGEGRLIVG
jgi:hypothetical protein